MDMGGMAWVDIHGHIHGLRHGYSLICILGYELTHTQNMSDRHTGI